jgi:hypothetical protein
MANAAGMLKESIWRDKDFRALPRSAQATYCELISQKDLDRAGLQPLQVAKWAKGCDEISDADIWDDLKVLESRRFVFVDEDTDELFIRSYMRHAEVARYPNILKNALRCAGLVASEKLRHELAKELRRLRKADAERVAEAIEPADYAEPHANPNETESNGSRTVPEGLNGSRTPTEPQGYGSRSGSVTLGSSQVGEVLDESRHDETGQTRSDPDSNDPPPSATCSKHPDGTDAACGPCGAAREARKVYDANAAQRKVHQRAAFWAEVRACPDCDERGNVETAANFVAKCPNHDWGLINA